MRKLLFLSGIVISIFGCTSHTDTDHSTITGATDKTFNELAARFLTSDMASSPENSVALGFHEYDGKLTDYSKAAIDSNLARLKYYDQQLGSIDTSTLSAKLFYDYRILKTNIRNGIFTIEDRQVYEKNPMTYANALDVSVYIKRNFGPIEQRIQSIINIEKGATNVFTYARQNLRDSLPKPYIDMAILISKGAASFLGKDLLIALKDVKNDTLIKAFTAANKNAIDQLNSYADWLKKDKLPKSTKDYAIGMENYSKMLLYQENISLSPDSILAIGMRELSREQAAFDAAAKIIDSTKKPIDVYNITQLEHPTADSLIPDARKTLEGIRQYIVDKKIVSIPSPVRVILKETPAFARETSTASMDIPGPFEKKATEAYYYITPVDKSWTAKQQEDWLAQFNYYTTDIVTIHEAYPGHYVQFLHLNASDATLIEKYFNSYAYVEGWAHYCEKMMIDEGYGNTGDPIKAAKFRIAQSGDALLRLCRLCVSIKTHCHGMSVDEATKFFMDHWHQGEKPSRQEALRGTFDPGYLFYAVGKLEILKLRADYQQQEGSNYSLLKFHDMFLGNGCPPVRLLRERMLKDSSSWDKIL